MKRIVELEYCVWRLADAILATPDIENHPELRAIAEEARFVLKDRLEVDDAKYRFHSGLGPFKDDWRLIKD